MRFSPSHRCGIVQRGQFAANFIMPTGKSTIRYPAVILISVIALLRPAPAHACPPWETGGEMAGTIQHPKVVESSGLAASRRSAGRFWTHNDSGDQPRLFLFDGDGGHAGAVKFKQIEAEDWEDMAVGPCSAGSDESCLYVADIGDNKAERETVSILRAPEPELPEELSGTLMLEPPTVIEFRYPGGPRDADAMMVHPETGTLYVVEKTSNKKAAIFRIPRDEGSDDTPVVAKPVGTISVNRGFGGHVTGGDISPAGDEFSVRTYIKVFTFCADEESFESAIEADPIESHPRFSLQSESLAYGTDGKTLWFTSEGKRAPQVRMRRHGTSSE